MNTVIDTLRLSENLQSSGFAAEQANALARALADEMGEQLATKQQFEGFETRMRQEFGEFKTEMRQELKRIDGELKVLSQRLGNLEIRFSFMFALLGLLVALELIPAVKAFVG